METKSDIEIVQFDEELLKLYQYLLVQETAKSSYSRLTNPKYMKQTLGSSQIDILNQILINFISRTCEKINDFACDPNQNRNLGNYKCNKKSVARAMLENFEISNKTRFGNLVLQLATE